MTQSPESLEQQVEAYKKAPPVHKWSPPISGDIDIRIDREGRWFHQGDEIRRRPLVRLFASILWYEQGEYFLVTPVEKWRIQVDEAPLLVIAMRRQGQGQEQSVSFETATGDKLVLDKSHPLVVEHNAKGEPLPKVRVRYELDALIHRNVFYELADLADEHPEMGWGVWSAGEFWPL
ncbi:DUF1285 domain-containing protein [Simiduia agarivorans]|uniref:Proteophosphoglycan n=1 Tax=Simiduia agarivorans (strain DSM 21679 / JCM 13881 / BCRC 17597 / SA1) TaxID=1117647 RepID=K4KEY7_SIMAS|nr:DUF1285 domain-containing protein [Simiduia agarivorans]AFU97624.1 hypothetical protein M5M_02025 [Simiduia agarivorans SA1 = DSM 21679]